MDFVAKVLTVGKSKTRTGSGRAIPLNAQILSVLDIWAAQFPNLQPNHYVFPFEKCVAKGEQDSFGFTAGVIFYGTDPTRPVGDWKKAWEKAKERAAAILKGETEEPKSEQQKRRGFDNRTAASERKPNGAHGRKPEALKCRFHDLRHTAVTRLLEAEILYPVVASMMGWSGTTAIRMAKRYGHIGSQALREAAEVLGRTKIPLGSLKKSPKSIEVRHAAIQ